MKLKVQELKKKKKKKNKKKKEKKKKKKKKKGLEKTDEINILIENTKLWNPI